MKKQTLFFWISILILHTTLSYAQDESSKIEVTKISDTIYKFFVNEFVNMTAFIGPDGALLVDSGFEEAAGQVKSILSTLGNSDIKYIINTHSDYDHIAGNRSLREHALIIAHTNCRDQMLKYIEPSFDLPFDKKIFEEGMPMITADDRLTLYFNNQEIHIIPLLGGHTDEDIIIYFENEGVACLGDMIFPDSFPVVKIENGGSVQKLLENIDTLIYRFSEDDILIVGHGRDMKSGELKEYRKMIVETVEIVSNAMKAGKCVEEMKKENVLRHWESWNSKLFPEDLNTDSWIETIVKSLNNSLQNYLRLSDEAYQSKDYAEFQRLMLKIVELAPQNYRYRYNLACAYALNGDQQNTINTLQFLLDQDYDLALLAATDSDFDSMREIAEFQEITNRIEEKTRPLNNSSIAFSIPEKDLIPEGIAYDPVDEAFYIGSVQKCKIIKIDKQGRISDFAEPRQDDLVKVLGLRVDVERRYLWAVSSYGFYSPDIPEELLGTTGVFRYDLQTRKLLKKYMLHREENHMLNDLTIDSNGDVYVTDWRIPAIYMISADKDTIEKFIDLPRRPNGIDFSGDGTKLFVAGGGVGVLDISTKTFRELKHPVNMYLSGDGLYYYQNSLIAVQNGGLRKVIRFYLNEGQDEIIRSEALEAYHPLFNLPTTGALVGNEFYFIANSQLRAYDEDGNLFPLSELEETKILKIELQ